MYKIATIVAYAGLRVKLFHLVCEEHLEEEQLPSPSSSLAITAANSNKME